MNRTTLNDLRYIQLWQHGEGAGLLTVIPDNGPHGLSMPIRRVFTVTDVPAGETRGDHAHLFCTQVVVCLHGRVSLRIDDGKDHVDIVLQHPAKALSIPPGLWNTLKFDLPDTIIVVYCDREYEAFDYIRDREQFQRIKTS